MTKDLISENMDLFSKIAAGGNGNITEQNIYQYLKILAEIGNPDAFCQEINKFRDMNINNPMLDLVYVKADDYNSFFG